MKPYPVTFHLYADSDEEVRTLQESLYNIVCDAYNDGVCVTAKGLTELLRNNYRLIKNLLK